MSDEGTPTCSEEEVSWSEPPFPEFTADEEIVVRRTTVEGNVTMTRAHRSSAEHWLLTDARGVERGLAATDVVEAVAMSAPLREVRPGTVTEIFLSPATCERAADILDQLRLVGLKDKESVWEAIGEGLVSAKTAELIDKFEDSSAWHGLMPRLIGIDGELVAVVPVAGRRRPTCVAVADGDLQWQDLWASFSFIENGSMTSGTSQWSIGLVSETIVAQLDRLDEEEVAIRCYALGSSSRVQVIVNWLLTLDPGADLAMHAAEMLVAEDSTSMYDLPSALFQEHGTWSSECDLWLDISPDGVDEAFDHLREGGRADVVDAVLDPQSRAGLERAARWQRFQALDPDSRSDDRDEV
jgi:hypothetical protein